MRFLADPPHESMGVAQVTVSYCPRRAYSLHFISRFYRLLEDSHCGGKTCIVSTGRNHDKATHSSLLYATTPSSFNNKGSVEFMAFAARKYSSASLDDASCRCSMPMNNSGRWDLVHQYLNHQIQTLSNTHPWNKRADVE
jgi:hypothetical protein